jgi:hypothetical protein
MKKRQIESSARFASPSEWREQRIDVARALQRVDDNYLNGPLSISLLLQPYCKGGAACIIAGAGRLKWKQDRRWERLVISRPLHARLRQAWPCSGCEHQNTTDATAQSCAESAAPQTTHPWLVHIDTAPVCIRDIKAVLCPPRRAEYTHCSIFRKQNSTSLS